MSSSRRRKPLVTRHVVTDEEESNDEDSRMTNGTGEPSNARDTENKNEIPEDLPEGTVIVEPEAVEESTFKGPEFPSSKKKVSEATGYLATVHCSACGEQINTSKKGDARRHPELSVLICKRCFKFHTSGPIEQDEDGLDEHCRWCSEGGNLFGCDYCHNAFCQSCIKRNLGRAEFSRVKDAEKFKCYVCNPAPLAAMVEQCNSVIDTITKEFQKLDEMAKKKKEIDKQKTSGKTPDGKDKTPKDVDKNKSLVIKLPGIGNKFPKTSTPKSKENAVTGAKPPVISQGTKDSPLSSLMKQTASIPLTTLSQPASFSSMLQQNATSQMAAKQNVIYVDTNKGSAKQLVYVQPKPHQVPMMSLVPPMQQARDPLVWNNVTVKNVPFITDQLIASTTELLNILRSLRANVQGNGNSLSNIALEGRRTAISCMKSGVDLFLGQLSSIVGTNLVQSSVNPTQQTPSVTAQIQPSQTPTVKLTGVNSSIISTSEKDLIILDSENDDSKMEVLNITDSAKNKDTVVKDKSVEEDKVIELKKEEMDIDTNKIISEKNKEVAGVSEDKTEKQSEQKPDKDENLKISEKSAEKKPDDESESVEAENDAAHLELLQELQELSGTLETPVKTKEDIKAEEKKSDMKNVPVTKVEADTKKDQKKDESSEESSSEESDYDSSDNSKKDSDFDIKTERTTRRTLKKEAEKNKFKELRSKRKEKEMSAKKKEEKKKTKNESESDKKSKLEKGKKKKAGSSESDIDDDFEDEKKEAKKKTGAKTESDRKLKVEKGKKKKEESDESIDEDLKEEKKTTRSKSESDKKLKLDKGKKEKSRFR